MTDTTTTDVMMTTGRWPEHRGTSLAQVEDDRPAVTRYIRRAFRRRG